MNVQLKDITVTARDGRVSHLDQVYIRGSHVRFFIVPDMLRYANALHHWPIWFNSLVDIITGQRLTRLLLDRNAPMFRTRGQRGRGVGLARGRATVQRARGQRRG